MHLKGRGLALLAVGAGGEAELFFKKAAEGLGRAESGFFSDFSNGKFSGAQECHGAVKSIVLDVTAKRNAGGLFKAGAEAGFGKVELAGQIANADGATFPFGHATINIAEQVVLRFGGVMSGGDPVVVLERE